jgi:hypothetical protein
MSDVARCLCPKDSTGNKCGRNTDCPFHGDTPKEPQKPYVLTVRDREVLKSMRIATADSDAIQQVRQADEDRWRRD